MKRKLRHGRVVRLQLASAVAVGILSAANARATDLFDNVTAREAGTGGGLYTTGSYDEYEGNGLNLLSGTADLTGFDLQVLNESGSTWQYVKINIYVWSALDTPGFNSTNPAFVSTSQLAEYSLVANYNASGGIQTGYQSTFEGTPGVTPGITLGTPLSIPSSTIGVTINLQGSNDGVTFSNVAALAEPFLEGAPQTVGSTQKQNDFDVANAGETNGNYISGPYVFTGYNYSSPYMRVFGDATNNTPDNWLNIAGGTWTDGTQWSSGNAPNGAVSAFFNLSSPSAYTVEIPAAENANNVFIQNDNVNFNLDAQTSDLAITSVLSVGTGTSTKGALTLQNLTAVNLGIVEPGSIVVGTNGGTGTLTVTDGVYLYSNSSTTIGAGSSLVVGAFGKLGTSTLSIAGTTGAWTGQLDIGSSFLNIRSGNIATVMSQLKSGYNNGLWNGQGIISSTAATDTTHLTAVGAILNNNGSGGQIYGSGTALGLFDGDNPSTSAVLVRYTYYGDANLDGMVDGSDYSLVDNGFLQHLTGWYNGDFNYDGVVDGSDYTLIDNAFNQQYGSITGESPDAADSRGVTAEDVSEFNQRGSAYITASDITPEPYSGDEVDLNGPSAAITAEIAPPSPVVPEPASMGLFAVAALAMLGRRSRHQGR